MDFKSRKLVDCRVDKHQSKRNFLKRHLVYFNSRFWNENPPWKVKTKQMLTLHFSPHGYMQKTEHILPPYLNQLSFWASDSFLKKSSFWGGWASTERVCPCMHPFRLPSARQSALIRGAWTHARMPQGINHSPPIRRSRLLLMHACIKALIARFILALHARLPSLHRRTAASPAHLHT